MQMKTPPIVRKRTAKTPTTGDTFLWRILHALDEPPRMLAANIGVPYEDIEPLLRPGYELIEQDRDETWRKINEHVDKRIGALMAARHELQRRLQKDVASRAARHAQQLARTKRSAPR